MKTELMDRVPPGSIAEAHKTGWMQSDIFVRWFQHFITHANPTAIKPVLLILDGHKTHTSNLPFIEMACKSHVVVLCLPPHCSHHFQPLDVTFMKPLMSFYTQEVMNWLRIHPGRIITTYQRAKLFRGGYMRAATMVTAVNGFAKTGIWPINFFSEHGFAAAAPTDIVLPHTGQINNAVADITDTINTTIDRTTSSPHGQVDTATTSQAVATPAITIVSPVPKVKLIAARKSSNRGETCIITSSPYKRELEDKEAAAAWKKHNKVRPSDTAVASTSGAHKLAKKRLVEPKRPNNSAKDVPCLYCGKMHENGEFVCEMCNTFLILTFNRYSSFFNIFSFN